MEVGEYYNFVIVTGMTGKRSTNLLQQCQFFAGEMHFIFHRLCSFILYVFSWLAKQKLISQTGYPLMGQFCCVLWHNTFSLLYSRARSWLTFFFLVVAFLAIKRIFLASILPRVMEFLYIHCFGYLVKWVLFSSNSAFFVDENTLECILFGNCSIV